MTPEASRQTIAQDVLGRDVINTINLAESAYGQGCVSSRVTKVQLISPPKKDNQSVTRATEHWHLDRCGTTVIYRVDFTEVQGRGTTIGIKLQ